MDTPCPDPRALRDFLLGHGGDTESRSIEAHLATCPRCVDQLRDLEAGDLFVEALKVGARAAPVVQETSPELVARLSALRPQEAAILRASPALAGATPVPAKGPPTLDFLDPAKEPGELGRLGDYRVLKVLGTGGMGVVLEAEDRRLGRKVALKVILESRALEPPYLARFKHEGAALARLQHSNIVQIHEVGEHRGRPFFALELVRGGTLAELLARQPQAFRASAELLATLAGAVDHAHRQGVIHRDLKPGNILLHSEQSAFPKIADFGLAKRLDDAGLTQSGDLLGTPGYMAPELTRGQGKDTGVQVDVYSLGAILYELLTGRAPFRGETVVDTLEQARTLDPVPPRRLEPKVPRDLDTSGGPGALAGRQANPGPPAQSFGPSLAVVPAQTGLGGRDFPVIVSYHPGNGVVHHQ